MRTQKEYMNFIKKEFAVKIKDNISVLDAYCYNDDRARTLINRFKKNIELLGFNLGLPLINVYILTTPFDY